MNWLVVLIKTMVNPQPLIAYEDCIVSKQHAQTSGNSTSPATVSAVVQGSFRWNFSFVHSRFVWDV